jgi:citrate lyase subunit beta/citryl-CoA lyase
VKLVPWIETAMAIVHVYDICRASPRVIGVAFGAEDFTHDMGIERTEDDSEVTYARSAMCVAARAADVLALDTPFFRFRDPEALQHNAQASKKIGFKGKFAIHPAQIDIINATFSPSAAEIDHARRVVAAFEQAERAGRGSTSLDGKVIDVPVVKRARALLEVAEDMVQRRHSS